MKVRASSSVPDQKDQGQEETEREKKEKGALSSFGKPETSVYSI